MAAAAGRVDVRRDGATATIRVDRAPLNVLDLATIAALDEALADVLDAPAAGPRAAIVVLRGGGERAFSAGVDLGDHTPDKVPAMLASFHGVIRRLWRAEAATVAAVDGVALGGGCELALACDLVVATERSVFGLPEIDVGCFPPVALAAMAGAVGPHRAADWILTGRRVSAAEAHAAGLVARLAPDGGLEAALDDVVGALRAKSPAVLRVIQRAARRISYPRLDEALKVAEAAYLEDLAKTQDMAEGVRSFLEKRRPAWSGR